MVLLGFFLFSLLFWDAWGQFVLPENVPIETPVVVLLTFATLELGFTGSNLIEFAP